MTERIPRTPLWLLAAAWALACSDTDKGSAAPVSVASVAVTPGAATLTVGATQAFTVTLKDIHGSILTGRTVTWTSSVPAVAVVSSEGVATGVTPGTVTITAESEGKVAAASLTVGPAVSVVSSVSITAGNNQAAPAGTRVPIAPSVKVIDENGAGVPGITVTFAVTSGGGSLSDAEQVTDAAGQATIGGWRLGANSGSNSMTATVAGLSGTPIRFTASAIDVSSALVPVTFCGDAPIWVAFQNDEGAWTQVARGGGGVYDLAIATRGAVAWVEQDTGGLFRTFVRYESRAELASEPCLLTAERPVERVWGNYWGIGADQTGALAMGSVSIRELPGGLNSLAMRPWPTFELLVPDRPLDLIAAKYDQQGNPFRGSVHRNLDLADGAKVPPDRGRGATLAPADTPSVYFQAGLDPTISSVYTVFGVGSSNWHYTNDFHTPRSEFTGFSSGNGSGRQTQMQLPATSAREANGSGLLGVDKLLSSGTVLITYFAMPTLEALPGDSYTFTFTEFDGSRERGFIHDLPYAFALSASNRLMVLGPDLSAPVVTTIATAPSVRVRAQISAQPAYAGTMSLTLSGESSKNAVQVLVTSGYSAGAGSWDVSMPDLTPAGFQSSWGIQPGEQSKWVVRGASERRLRQQNLAPLAFATIRQP